MHSLVEELSLLLLAQNKVLATAESCTGGMIAAAMTDRAGSSAIFDRGFVTYSNQAKMDMLGVQEQTLKSYGAVSEQTARVMVLGALNNSSADIAVSVTGIAGPSGGSADKPVGLVFIGVGEKNKTISVTRHVFDGDRTTIRQQTVECALELAIKALQ
jgi:nicotinamide-nucleotide amidase